MILSFPVFFFFHPWFHLIPHGTGLMDSWKWVCLQYHLSIPSIHFSIRDLPLLAKSSSSLLLPTPTNKLTNQPTHYLATNCKLHRSSSAHSESISWCHDRSTNDDWRLTAIWTPPPLSVRHYGPSAVIRYLCAGIIYSKYVRWWVESVATRLVQFTRNATWCDVNAVDNIFLSRPHHIADASSITPRSLARARCRRRRPQPTSRASSNQILHHPQLCIQFTSPSSSVVVVRWFIRNQYQYHFHWRLTKRIAPLRVSMEGEIEALFLANLGVGKWEIFNWYNRDTTVQNSEWIRGRRYNWNLLLD